MPMSPETSALLGATLTHIEHLSRIGDLMRRLMNDEPITVADLERAVAFDEKARRDLDFAIQRARAQAQTGSPPHRSA